MKMRAASASNSHVTQEMRTFRRAKFWLLVLLIGTVSATARAKEPYLEFIHGLREHRHYEYALSYMDDLEGLPDLPTEVRLVIPYERGMTLLEQSRQTFDLDRQRDYLDRATAALEQFVAVAGDHPLAGEANTSRAIILLERAKVEIWKSEEPANEGNEELFRQAARDLVSQARSVFEAALQLHQAAFESFDIFIPEEETELRAQRDEAEARYLQGKMYLAQCTYWLAHTYAKDSAEYRDTLTQASVEFEEIHTAHRSQIVGLYARIWQGKCFEEQDELGPAIGIYDQFIDHPGTEPVILRLRSTALQFKLICLNHDLRKDYQVANQLAGDWLGADETRLLRRESVGLGITFERARALEGLAMSLAENDSQRSDMLNQALGLARSINLFPGQYKIQTTRMIQRIMLALNRDPGDPQNFEAAFGLGSQFLDDVSVLVNQIQQLKATGDRTELANKLESLRSAAQEMTRLFDLAIRLAEPTTDPRQLLLAHLRLAYGYVNQQKYYEAAAIAEYLMQKRAQDVPDLAVESGFIGVLAYDNAYTQAPADNRQYEGERLIEMATRLEQLFPDSARANDARETVGKVFFNQRDYIQAAEWYSKVPASAEKYGVAQINTGQCFWNAYLTATQLPPAERPMEFNSWMDLAESHLMVGIAESQAQLPQDAPTTDDLARGKLSLAAIRIQKGIFTTQGEVLGALEILSAEPHSVVSATRIQPGASRPNDNSIHSASTASFALQQLLRAQIGAASVSEGDARQAYLDASANTRVLLEELASEEDDQGRLTQIYIEFGAELQKELTRIQESGDVERLRSTRESFESFLNDVADRQEGQNMSSLLWIAETFAALGENASDDAAKAEAFFARAAGTFETMLNRAINEPGFVESQDQIVPIRLSLARTHRRAGDFAASEAALNEVLKDHSDVLAVQEEAALLFELWGESGESEKYQLAIHGRETAPAIWGWGRIGLTLQRAMQQANTDPDAVDAFLNAKTHQVACLLGYGKSGNGNDQTRALELARFTLESLSLTYDDALLAPRMSDFDRQYGEILAALDQPVVPLSQVSAANRPEGSGSSGQQATRTVPTTPEEDDDESSSGGTNWGLILGMLVLGGGSVVGVCFLSMAQSKKRRRANLAKVNAASDKSRGRVKAR